MAKSLKESGVNELGALKRRVRRQHALERISKPDHDKLIALIDEIEATIVNMDEEGDGQWQ